MGYLDEDDPDYYEDRRRARDDMKRAMREERRYGDDEEVFEFFLTRGLVLLAIVALTVGSLYFGADFLDNQFGWHLTEWLNNVLPEPLRRS